MGFALILVIIGWLYVALLMALAEAMSPVGSWLGAVFTFVLYGVLPLSILVYVLATPLRKKRREQLERQAPPPDDQA